MHFLLIQPINEDSNNWNKLRRDVQFNPDNNSDNSDNDSGNSNIYENSDSNKFRLKRENRNDLTAVDNAGVGKQKKNFFNLGIIICFIKNCLLYKSKILKIICKLLNCLKITSILCFIKKIISCPKMLLVKIVS